MTRALVRRHARAGLHGGLCPEAVPVDPQGRVTLVETPRSVEERIRYCAPEQSGRLSRDVDERADLYALGAMLVELATGAPPFPGTRPAEFVRAQLAARVPAPSMLPPGIREVVEELEVLNV